MCAESSAVAITVIAVVVPIIVTVPVAVGTPFMAIRVVPGVGLAPAAVPFSVQFGPGIFRLTAVFAMFMGFVPVVVSRFFNPALAV